MSTNPLIKVFYANPLGQRLHFDSSRMFKDTKAAEIYFSEFYGVECHCEIETTEEATYET